MQQIQLCEEHRAQDGKTNFLSNSNMNRQSARTLEDEEEFREAVKSFAH